MNEPFDPKKGPIIIRAEVTGPNRSMPLQLLLDTGATRSVLSENVLLALGYDLSSVSDRVQMTTGSASHTVSRVVLTRLSSLGQYRFGFAVLAHNLPLSASYRGLLGLDFLRGNVLTVDFKAGLVTLA